MDKAVILYHLGNWYKAYNDSAKVISFIMDYKLYEDSNTKTPTVGFPESSIDKVVDILRRNRINYILKNDDNKLVDFKKFNNFDSFLHNDLPFSYVVPQGEITKQIKGSFVVKYEGEGPEEYIIGEDINQDTELVKKVVTTEEGKTFTINDYNVLLIRKNIEK